MSETIRGKIVEPIYKKEIRDIPYCPKCGYRLEGSEEDYFGDTVYRCACGFWTYVWVDKLKKFVFKLTKRWY